MGQLRNLCSERRIPFVTQKASVQLYAKTNQIGIEEAGRVIRYQFLFLQARAANASAVAVAHTANDRVETFIMHLLRGAGLNGLKGMPFYALPNEWSQAIPLIRPVLGIYRSDILKYLAENNLEPAFDSSNEDVSFFRNRIRQELIPLLKTYNPQFEEGVIRTIISLSDDWENLEALFDRSWQTCLHKASSSFVAFHLDCLAKHNRSTQRALIRRALYKISSDLEEITFDRVEKVIDLIASPQATGRHDFANGVLYYSDSNYLWIVGRANLSPVLDFPQLSKEIHLTDLADQHINFDNDWECEIQVENLSPQSSQQDQFDNTNRFEARLDADRLPEPLHFRQRKPGERIHPLGMHGQSMKISDLMINAKIPQHARQAWPILVAGADIAWVTGIRVGHPFRVTDTTVRIIHLIVYKKQE
jgi:tRNA(Ile)-lysidine synthase